MKLSSSLLLLAGTGCVLAYSNPSLGSSNYSNKGKPTATPTPKPTATPTPKPTATPTPKPTTTPTPRPNATATPLPTATPIPEPTATPLPEPTATPVPEPTATPTSDPNTTPVPEPTPTAVPTATPVPLPTPLPIRLVAYRDTWASAVERWWDMGAQVSAGKDVYNQFNDWVSVGQPNGKFNYTTRAGNVVLTYNSNPTTPYFVGHISAKGLKPNFVYQLKLTGKPVNGPRGAGKNQSYVLATSKLPGAAPDARVVVGVDGQALPINGDDWTNQQLGYAGRWWNDSNASGNTNAITDSVYQANTSDTIYGYQFMGDFVTDKYGNAEADIDGSHSYHITWQGWQNGYKDVFFGTFNISGFLDQSSPAHYYGYGSYAPSTGDTRHQENGKSVVSLYYELEAGRPNPVVLAKGTYHCRLLITEETFHNLYGATSGTLGGKWKTVMATEDFDPTTGAPDSNSLNDIVFTVK